MNPESSHFDIDFARKLIAFNFWENRRVWDTTITPLNDAQFTRKIGFSQGSIRRECIHIIDTERISLQCVTGALSAEGLRAEAFADRNAIEERWIALRQGWHHFADRLDADVFFSDCFLESNGVQNKIKTWKLIFHVIYHGTAHRAEIMRMVAEVHQPAQFDLSLMQYLTGVFRK